MNYRNILLSGIVGLGLHQSCVAETKESKPNVLFFLVDDMGWMDAGYQGSKFYETPNID